MTRVRRLPGVLVAGKRGGGGRTCRLVAISMAVLALVALVRTGAGVDVAGGEGGDGLSPPAAGASSDRAEGSDATAEMLQRVDEAVAGAGAAGRGNEGNEPIVPAGGIVTSPETNAPPSAATEPLSGPAGASVETGQSGATVASPVVAPPATPKANKPKLSSYAEFRDQVVSKTVGKDAAANHGDGGGDPASAAEASDGGAAGGVDGSVGSVAVDGGESEASAGAVERNLAPAPGGERLGDDSIAATDGAAADPAAAPAATGDHPPDASPGAADGSVGVAFAGLAEPDADPTPATAGTTGSVPNAASSGDSGVGSSGSSGGAGGSGGNLGNLIRKRKRSAHKFNFASDGCGAKVLDASRSQAGSKPSSVLKDSKDQYWLSTCAADTPADGAKWIMIELCEEIRVEAIKIANFEIFSSMFRRLRVLGADTFPGDDDEDWLEMGLFEVANERELQEFEMGDGAMWAKYVRLEFAGAHGSEVYCPLSVVQVFGATLIQDFKEGLFGTDEHVKMYEISALDVAEGGGRGDGGGGVVGGADPTGPAAAAGISDGAVLVDVVASAAADVSIAGGAESLSAADEATDEAVVDQSNVTGNADLNVSHAAGAETTGDAGTLPVDSENIGADGRPCLSADEPAASGVFDHAAAVEVDVVDLGNLGYPSTPLPPSASADGVIPDTPRVGDDDDTANDAAASASTGVGATLSGASDAATETDDQTAGGEASVAAAVPSVASPPPPSIPAVATTAANDTISEPVPPPAPTAASTAAPATTSGGRKRATGGDSIYKMLTRKVTELEVNQTIAAVYMEKLGVLFSAQFEALEDAMSATSAEAAALSLRLRQVEAELDGLRQAANSTAELDAALAKVELEWSRQALVNEALRREIETLVRLSYLDLGGSGLRVSYAALSAAVGLVVGCLNLCGCVVLVRRSRPGVPSAAASTSDASPLLATVPASATSDASPAPRSGGETPRTKP